MCGIIGYAGPNTITELRSRIKAIEYRGYEGMGAAVLSSNGIHCRKSGSKNLRQVFDGLRKEIGGQNNLKLGIAHTRWPTHGKAGDLNSHPQYDPERRIFVVHNGVIENIDVLRKHFPKNYDKFVSETDTEVFAHLLARHYIGDKNLEGALRETLRQYPIEGDNSFVIMGVHNEAIVGVHLGQPLNIGLGNEFCVIASDSGACGGVEKIIHLEFGDVAIVKARSMRLIDYRSGKAIEREAHPPHYFPEDVSGREGESEQMFLEIVQQPDVLFREKRHYFEDLYPSLLEKKTGKAVFRYPERLVITGCGSSYYAGLLIAQNLRDFCRIPVNTYYASEFPLTDPIFFIDPRPDVLFISQSGETRDILDVLRGLPPGLETFTICNRPDSELARKVSLFLPMVAGKEDGVAATKSFTATLLAGHIIGLWWAQLKKEIDRQKFLSLAGGLNTFPALAREAIEASVMTKNMAKSLKKARHMYFLGRGYSWPVALEGALKMKEVAYIPSEGMPAGEMKHGPLALIEKGTPVVFVIPEDKASKQTMINLEEVRSRGGRIIAITTPGSALLTREKEHLKGIEHIITVPKVDSPLLQAILTVVPLQLLAYWTAIHRGLNPTRPRNLAKSVTVR